LYTIQKISNPNIIIPNNNNIERLYNVSLLIVSGLLNLSIYILKTSNIILRIHIIKNMIITLVDIVSFSELKNPPGYVENKIVITITNIMNIILPYFVKLEIFCKIFVDLFSETSGNVKRTIKYNIAKTPRTIVINNE
jgi:hypothetical protein